MHSVQCTVYTCEARSIIFKESIDFIQAIKTNDTNFSQCKIFSSDNYYYASVLCYLTLVTYIIYRYCLFCIVVIIIKTY